jgi:tRNA pseudouridine55 synthase
VTLSAVPVRVTRAEILEFTGLSARIALTCSSGFYVRSFAHRLGELVGTGACLESLRRTRSGEFTIDQAVDLERLQQSSTALSERWIPLERLLPGLPSTRLDEEGRKRVTHGQKVEKAHVSGPVPDGTGWVRLIDDQGRLVALGTRESAGESLHPAIVLI